MTFTCKSNTRMIQMIYIYDTADAVYIALRYITLDKIRLHQITKSFHMILHQITLYYITSHYITLHHITSHFISHIISYVIISYHIYITWHHIPVHCVTLHYIALHRIALHCATLHYLDMHVCLYLSMKNGICMQLCVYDIRSIKIYEMFVIIRLYFAPGPL